MKNKRLALVLLFLTFGSTGYLFARNILWNPKSKPPVSLPEAHEIALAALKDRHVDFYCTGASLAKTFSEGDWEFRFSAADGSATVVSVGSDKQTRVSDRGFSHY